MLFPVPGACTGESETMAKAAANSQAEGAATPGSKPAQQSSIVEPPDVIARVGDQTITFGEINTMMNSAAIVGLSMPELGTPERLSVRITLLDKMISGNLLYLDALQKGVDQDPEYQQSMESFRDGILANLYRSKVLVGDIEVSDRDIEDFYRNNIVEGTEFTEELKKGIEATIRKQRVMERKADMREHLREGHKTSINVTDLDPADDVVRNDNGVLAELDGVPITWREARSSLQRANTMRSTQARIEALEKLIDTRIMTQKAKEAGLEQDPVFQARLNEFSKTRLINLHRKRLLKSWEPTEEEIRDYYEKNQKQIIIPEVRKVQMLVVKTKGEAEELKKKIEAREITFHQAVADYSIVPDARKTLGQVGWVSEGSGFADLDQETFLLEAGEIGGPVQSPAGWHLVRVLDQRDALHKNIYADQTRKHVRKLYLDDKLDEYVVSLRKESFPVEVDDEKFSELSQQEIDWYQEMLQKAQKSPEEVIEEIKKLQK
jgi:parvulin-like peptidyl-prolyl isomerase